MPLSRKSRGETGRTDDILESGLGEGEEEMEDRSLCPATSLTLSRLPSCAAWRPPQPLGLRRSSSEPSGLSAHGRQGVSRSVLGAAVPPSSVLPNVTLQVRGEVLRSGGTPRHTESALPDDVQEASARGGERSYVIML